MVAFFVGVLHGASDVPLAGVVVDEPGVTVNNELYVFRLDKAFKFTTAGGKRGKNLIDSETERELVASLL